MMNRITGVYSPKVYFFGYQRADGHAFIFKYTRNADLVETVKQYQADGSFSMLDAARVTSSARLHEWVENKKGV